eukprot:1238583-Amphidinium_carterae.1
MHEEEMTSSTRVTLGSPRGSVRATSNPDMLVQLLTKMTDAALALGTGMVATTTLNKKPHEVSNPSSWSFAKGKRTQNFVDSQGAYRAFDRTQVTQPLRTKAVPNFAIQRKVELKHSDSTPPRSRLHLATPNTTATVLKTIRGCSKKHGCF